MDSGARASRRVVASFVSKPERLQAPSLQPLSPCPPSSAPLRTIAAPKLLDSAQARRGSPRRTSDHRSMAAADSDPAISISTCPHCQREIPSSNIALHSAHYARNLQNRMWVWDLHTGVQCPQRMLECQYCQFELPEVDLFEHQDVWKSNRILSKLQEVYQTS
uniref:Uncharacterized protein n=1 Tax=Zea mays TaxID=4577 RepID=A0A804QFY4_MAIZE